MMAELSKALPGGNRCLQPPTGVKEPEKWSPCGCKIHPRVVVMLVGAAPSRIGLSGPLWTRMEAARKRGLRQHLSTTPRLVSVWQDYLVEVGGMNLP